MEDAEGPVQPKQLRGQLQGWAGRLVTGLGSAEDRCVLSRAKGLYAELEQGVVLVELFGGLCAGSEACLRNGWKVARYVYSDRDPAVRRVAWHRVAALAAEYPEQLSLEACEGAFSLWPQDVGDIRSHHVEQLRCLGKPCMLWAGWECQDLSPAGSGRGLAGRHSSTFFALHGVLEQLGGCFWRQAGVRAGEYGDGRALAGE
jgi:hypothetical protein